jgi:hypothetical protein
MRFLRLVRFSKVVRFPSIDIVPRVVHMYVAKKWVTHETVVPIPAVVAVPPWPVDSLFSVSIFHFYRSTLTYLFATITTEFSM